MINIASPATPSLLSAAKLASTTSVAQSLSWDVVDQFWYVCQRNVTEGDMDRILISRLDADGRLLDSMLIGRAGHGANIGVERTGGKVFLWTDAMPQGGWATAVARIPYAAGGTADASDLAVTAIHEPRTGVYRVSATVDPITRQLIYRGQTDDVASPSATGFVDRYDLDAAAAGTFTRLASIPHVSDRTLQGYTSLGGHLYTLYGDASGANLTVTCADWGTGTVIKTQRVKTFDSLAFGEPEGICVFQPDSAAPEAATLAFGVADGVSGGRNYHIARFPHPGTSPWVGIPYNDTLYTPNSANYVPQFRLDDDQVHLHFSLSKTSGAAWTNGEVLFTLPVRARPDRTQRLLGVVSGAGVTDDTMAVRFEVTTDGSVTIYDERKLKGWVGADHSFWRC